MSKELYLIKNTQSYVELERYSNERFNNVFSDNVQSSGVNITSTITFGNKIYIAGYGFQYDNPDDEIVDMYLAAFDKTTNTLSSNKIDIEGAILSLCILDDTIYVAGYKNLNSGNTETNFRMYLATFNPSTDTLGTDLVENFSSLHHNFIGSITSIVSFKDEICIGGFLNNSEGNNTFIYFAVYNPSNGNLNEIYSYDTVGTIFDMVVFNGRVFIAGNEGVTDSGDPNFFLLSFEQFLNQGHTGGWGHLGSTSGNEPIVGILTSLSAVGDKLYFAGSSLVGSYMGYLDTNYSLRDQNLIEGDSDLFVVDIVAFGNKIYLATSKYDFSSISNRVISYNTINGGLNEIYNENYSENYKLFISDINISLEESKDEDNSSVGIIIGAIVGLVLFIGLIYYFYKK